MDRYAHLLSRLSDTLELAVTPLWTIARPWPLFAATILFALSSLAGSIAARQPESLSDRRERG